MVISQAYRVSIEAEGAAARPDWEYLAAQDESIALLREAQQVGLVESRSTDGESTGMLARWLREALDSTAGPAELALVRGNLPVHLGRGQRLLGAQARR